MTHSLDSNEKKGLEIAIIGMTGRFPRAGNVDEFWRNLRDGVEAIERFTDEEQLAAGVPAFVLRDRNYVNAGTFLEGAEDFDAAFFGFSPREAEMMDPQHRVFLECAWDALESTGYDSEQFWGRIGVFAGVSSNSYLLYNLYQHRDLIDSVGEFQTLLGNDRDFLPTRVSYKLNLKGPSINVQTACSTSLVAIHLACQSLLAGECDMALAGGVTIGFPQKVGYYFQEGGILSPDGHCRAFDARAQGTVAGNGVGIVVLKRLEDALADRDEVQAIIRGSAINNDGALRAGFTAPSVEGQASVISDALLIAGVEPQAISYVETHGSATPLGDPIEIAALTRAFHTGAGKKSYCAIGSVKTNIGHLDAAAGVASLVKTVLALKNRMLPPSLNYEQPNPKIDFGNNPFYVNAKLAEWRADGEPLRAGISSFGLGGTNAHVIIEEPPAAEPSGKSRSLQLVLLSAKTDSALESATANLVEYFKNGGSQVNFADAAYTLKIGRRSFNNRRMLVCRSREDAINALESRSPERVLTSKMASNDRPVAFMFSGLGDHYVNAALGLYQSEPVFREQVDLCCEMLKPDLELDLRDVLYPGGWQSTDDKAEVDAGNASSRIDLRRMLRGGSSEDGAASERLNRTYLTQPAVFVIEYALAKLLMSWGIHPSAMIGYSIGEYTAACLAEVFSLEDALKLVAFRARVIEGLPAGAMLAVPLSAEEVEPLLGDGLSLSAINGPSLCVVSGPVEANVELENKLTARGLVCRRLQTSHAFHSSMMEPAVAACLDYSAKVTFSAPRMPFVSNVTGTWITPEQATDPRYWARHMCEAVRFGEGIEQLWKDADFIFLEIGPGQTLSTLIKSHPKSPAGCPALSSLRYVYDRQPDLAFLLTTVGRLWLAGAQVNWDGFYAREKRRRVPLPTYPFERKRYRIEPPGKRDKPASQSEISPSGRAGVAEWFYVPVWKQSSIRVRAELEKLASAPAAWLVFMDTSGLGDHLTKRLRLMGHDVLTVEPGSEFARLAPDRFSIDPQKIEDYEALFEALRDRDGSINRIIHLWSVSPRNSGEQGPEQIERDQQLGFFSLLYLAQSLAEADSVDALEIFVLSDGMQPVSGEEKLRPQKATVLGPCKVIPKEYGNITCRSIDVVLPERGTWAEEILMDSLLAEFASRSSDSIIAYRGANRWIQTYEKTELDAKGEAGPPLRERGVYLITGGLGGMGLEIARYLAETVQARLVLIGRTALPPRQEWENILARAEANQDESEKLRKLQDIEALGGELFLFSADVSSSEQMESAVRAAREKFGTINGVIHAAGVAGGGIIQLKTKEMAESVLAPKVKGTLVIDALFGDQELDFLVLFSALGSIIGGPAQVDYCGANAFLDAFAHSSARRNSRRTISINWDIWREVGLAVKTEVPLDLRHLRQEEIKEGMSSAEGVDAFGRILRARNPQVIVSMRDLNAVLEEIKNFSAAGFLEDFDKAHQSKPLHPRPDLQNPFVAPRNEIERKIAEAWEQLLGIEKVGIYDNFLELGGHSLLATQVNSRLRTVFEVDLPLRKFFEKPTIAGLAEAIQLSRDEEDDSSLTPIRRRPVANLTVDQLLSEVEKYSDQEARSILGNEAGQHD